MTGEQVVFLAVAGAAVLTALATIMARNPIHSGALLVLSFINIAGLFALLGADFLAVAMVIIYGGAILVLVVFVVMLVRMDDLPEMSGSDHPVQRVVAPLVGLAVLAEIVAAVFLTGPGGFPLGIPGEWTREAIRAAGGNAQAFGRVLYTDYLFPFVIVSLVLVAAAVGSIVLARETLTDESEATATISLGEARSRVGLRRLEALAQARNGRDDAAALANAALGERVVREEERHS